MKDYFKYDKCVLCGKITDEPEGRNISFRNNYVEGVGQLCYECAHKLY